MIASRLALALSAGMFVLAAAPAAAETLYSFTDLGTLAGWVLVSADGINEAGQIIGHAYNMDGSGYSYRHAFLLTPYEAPPPVSTPEPATWAMMIGGFALSGVAMRRRGATVRFA